MTIRPEHDFSNPLTVSFPSTTTWIAVVTAAPTPGSRTITFIDGPGNPPIGTKLRVYAPAMSDPNTPPQQPDPNQPDPNQPDQPAPDQPDNQ